jgi:hypothetical protein
MVVESDGFFRILMGIRKCFDQPNVLSCEPTRRKKEREARYLKFQYFEVDRSIEEVRWFIFMTHFNKYITCDTHDVTLSLYSRFLAILDSKLYKYKTALVRLPIGSSTTVSTNRLSGHKSETWRRIASPSTTVLRIGTRKYRSCRATMGLLRERTVSIKSCKNKIGRRYDTGFGSRGTR